MFDLRPQIAETRRVWHTWVPTLCICIGHLFAVLTVLRSLLLCSCCSLSPGALVIERMFPTDYETWLA